VVEAYCIPRGESARGGRIKRFILVLIPALMLCVANAAQSFAASSVESDCKNGLNEAKTKIEAMSNRATKRQAKALAQDATDAPTAAPVGLPARTPRWFGRNDPSVRPP